MKRIALISLVFSLVFSAGCSIVLSPALYGPPYYGGPGYYPPLVVVTPVPVEIGPVIVVPSWWPYGYYYGGGYYRYYRHHYYHYRHH